MAAPLSFRAFTEALRDVMAQLGEGQCPSPGPAAGSGGRSLAGLGPAPGFSIKCLEQRAAADAIRILE